MSRSYKKNPVFKDPNNKWGKRQANKRQRKRTKESIHHEKDSMPLLKEVFNTYNFVDFKHTEFENPNSIEGRKIRRK
jgi:hypothetical protein